MLVAVGIILVLMLCYCIYRQDLSVSLYCLCITSTLLVPSSVKYLSLSPSTIFSYLLFLVSFVYLYKHLYKYEKDTISLLRIIIYYFIIYLCLLPLARTMTILLQINDLKITLLECQLPFSIALILNSRKKVIYIYDWILFITYIVCIYDLICIILQLNPYYIMVGGTNAMETAVASLSDARGGLEGRYGSTVGNALYYSVCVLILLYSNAYGFLVSHHRRIKKMLYYVAFLLLLLNLFFTGSRSTMIAVCIGGFYYMYKRISIIKCAFYSFCLYILFCFLLTLNVFGKYQPLIESTIYFWNDEISSDSGIKGSSLSMRLIQLVAAFSEIDGSAFFFGNGAGWPWWYTETKGVHPYLLGFESVLFSGLTEFGVLGFILIYIIFYMLLYHYVKKRRKIYKCSLEKIEIINSYLLSYAVVAFMTSPYYFTLFLGTLFLMLKSLAILNLSSSEK